MPEIIKHRHEIFAYDDIVSNAASTILDDCSYQAIASIPIIETSDLVGGCFLIGFTEDKQHLRLKIVHDLGSHQCDSNDYPASKEFIINSKDDSVKEIMSYNEILYHIKS